jgi:hypothetical protein
MVPNEPINQGRFVRIYSFSCEWNRMPAPYVAFPISDRRKKSRAKPGRISYRHTITAVVLTFA